MAKGLKGFYFSIDALLAIVILVMGIMAFYQLSPSSITSDKSYVLSNDFINLISVMQIGEVNNTYIQSLVSNGTIGNPNNTILQQVGLFWAENKSDIANSIISNFSDGLLPPNFGFGVYMGNEPVYESGSDPVYNLISTSRMVSGITKFEAIEGFLSRLIITGVEKKIISSYYYFGGYVGDGNISFKITLPDVYDNVTEAYLELAVNESFELYINAVYSGSYDSQHTDDMRASKWILNQSYYSNFQEGANTIRLDYSGLGYIGGGFFRIDTFSNQTNFTDVYYNGTHAIKKEYFPGIQGIVNLYSSMYVPGDLESLKFHLHFDTNDKTILNVGGTEVYANNTGMETTIDLTDSSLTGLDYDYLSKKTVPLRLRLLGSNFTGPGVDSVMVTDVSGSMDECSGIYHNATMCKYQYCTFYLFGCWSWAWTQCEYQGTCSDDECSSGTTRTRNHEVLNGSLCYSKLEIAQQADKIFVDIVLNNSNNKVGLASYEQDLDSWTDLTASKSQLYSNIDSYVAGGGTCICCGIYKAADLLPDERPEFMVVLSDGDANYKCSGPGDYTGAYDTANAPQSAIDAGQYACSRNITVYTIGFGEGVSQQGTETLKQIACNQSLYYNATDTSALQEIIYNISSKILEISFSLQTAYSSLANNTLFNDSYVEFTYKPITPPIVYGKIPFTVEGDVFSNNISTGSFYVLPNVTVIDARVTSYSGNKWTHKLRLENSAHNTTVFQLSDFGSLYLDLGDPFYVNIPSNYVADRINNVTITSGVGPLNDTGGSEDDRAIYTFLAKNSLGYSALGSRAEGCIWTIRHEDNSTGIIDVPTGYSGNKTCDFENAIYDPDDSLDAAFYQILSYYDFDDDGLVDILIDESSIRTEEATVSDVPSLWGPVLAEVRIWQ